MLEQRIPEMKTPKLTRDGAHRLRDAVECDDCLMDEDAVCPAHKLLHSMEREAKRWGKSRHEFDDGTALLVYSDCYRWWHSVGLVADDRGLAYAFHVPKQPCSQVKREQAVTWLRDALR